MPTKMCVFLNTSQTSILKATNELYLLISSKFYLEFCLLELILRKPKLHLINLPYSFLYKRKCF